MNIQPNIVDNVRIKRLANLSNANKLKISYFDKQPEWLKTAIDSNDITLHNGLIYVAGNSIQAQPGDYLIRQNGVITIQRSE